MSLEFTTVEREGHITVITINRPEVMNALHGGANAELGRIFDEFAADPEQWVAIITGTGERAFSAGNDLKATAKGTGGRLQVPSGPGFGGLTTRFDLDKPVIAAVNGLAMGGGFEIALACDIIVAAENAVFSLPEPRVGVAALAGGLFRLARAIGDKRAMEMILTSRVVTAEEAKALGFVANVCAKGEALSTARTLAARICEASPLSIRASKAAVQQGLEMNLEQALREQWEFRAMRRLLTSEDFAEGPRAFAEKRAPNWQGK